MAVKIANLNGHLVAHALIFFNFRGFLIGLLLYSNYQMMIFAEDLDMMQFIILIFKNF